MSGIALEDVQPVRISQECWNAYRKNDPIYRAMAEVARDHGYIIVEGEDE